MLDQISPIIGLLKPDPDPDPDPDQDPDQDRVESRQVPVLKM
jgi:hypothetical protein